MPADGGLSILTILPIFVFIRRQIAFCGVAAAKRCSFDAPAGRNGTRECAFLMAQRRAFARGEQWHTDGSARFAGRRVTYALRPAT
jgi:hypothetical protein